jgi:hypothetical protein
MGVNINEQIQKFFHSSGLITSLVLGKQISGFVTPHFYYCLSIQNFKSFRSTGLVAIFKFKSLSINLLSQNKGS